MTCTPTQSMVAWHTNHLPIISIHEGKKVFFIIRPKLIDDKTITLIKGDVESCLDSVPIFIFGGNKPRSTPKPKSKDAMCITPKASASSENWMGHG